ncbi:hypothetical protein M408DRAFT_85536 [Serendipita vermifera MAFF 305830]|uniref:Uncharacterized protein n=1 Tax=Serendipita vermifera MAFF 305830 TaxID=933852 RepID=A0A0C2XY65_SERVB|nr:hypothetical protein M408DRAFT_85536 [Serendipita vermifera MAFF 305830]
MTGVRPTSNTSSSTTQSPVNESSLTRMPSNSSSSGNLATLNNNRANASTPQLTNNSSTPSDSLNLLETFGISPSPDVNFAQSSTLTGLTPPSGSFTMMDNAFFGNTPPAGSSGGLNDLGFSSSFGDFPSSFAPMPYQTIASNNMFTSFRDPTENPNAWASFGPNSSQSQSLKNTYDELFGAGTSLSGNDDLNMSSLGGIGSTDELMPFSFLPDMSNGAGGSQFGGLSPISHLPTPPSASSAAGQQSAFASTPVSQQDHDMAVSQPQQPASATSAASKNDGSWMLDEDGKRCPRTTEEVESVMAKVGSGTFGPNPGGEETEATCEKKMADATKLNLDIGTAWRAVRQHPQFEVCPND